MWWWCKVREGRKALWGVAALHNGRLTPGHYLCTTYPYLGTIGTRSEQMGYHAPFGPVLVGSGGGEGAPLGVTGPLAQDSAPIPGFEKGIAGATARPEFGAQSQARARARAKRRL